MILAYLLDRLLMRKTFLSPHYLPQIDDPIYTKHCRVLSHSLSERKHIDHLGNTEVPLIMWYDLNPKLCRLGASNPFISTNVLWARVLLFHSHTPSSYPVVVMYHLAYMYFLLIFPKMLYWACAFLTRFSNCCLKKTSYSHKFICQDWWETRR